MDYSYITYSGGGISRQDLPRCHEPSADAAIFLEESNASAFSGRSFSVMRVDRYAATSLRMGPPV
jgi:hypothetical protein